MTSRRTNLALAGVAAIVLGLVSFGVQAGPPANDADRDRADTPGAVADDCTERHSFSHRNLHAMLRECHEDLASWFHGSRRAGRSEFGKAWELYQNDRFDEAAAAFEKAMEAGAERGLCAYDIACCHARLGRHGEAIEWLKRATAEGFDFDDLLDTDDDLDVLRGDTRFEQMRETARLARGAQDDEDAAWEREEAIEEYEGLRAEGSLDGGDWYDAGMDLHGAGEHEHALAAWAQARDLGNDGGATTYNIACANARLGRTDAAFEALHLALERGYGSEDWLRGDDDLDSLRSDARFEGVLAAARALEIDADPGDRNVKPEVWEALARRSAGHLANNPDSGRAWFNTGLARLRLGQLAESDVAFRRALELGHSPGVTQYDLACVAAQRGEIDAAFDWLSRAIVAGFDQGMLIATDDDLKPLHSDGRWAQIKEQAFAGDGVGWIQRHLGRTVVRFL